MPLRRIHLSGLSAFKDVHLPRVVPRQKKRQLAMSSFSNSARVFYPCFLRTVYFFKYDSFF